MHFHLSHFFKAIVMQKYMRDGFFFYITVLLVKEIIVV